MGADAAYTMVCPARTAADGLAKTTICAVLGEKNPGLLSPGTPASAGRSPEHVQLVVPMVAQDQAGAPLPLTALMLSRGAVPVMVPLTVIPPMGVLLSLLNQ